MRIPERMKANRGRLAALLAAVCMLAPGLLSGTSHAALEPDELPEIATLSSYSEPATPSDWGREEEAELFSVISPVYWEETPVWTAGYDGRNLLLFFRMAFLIMDDSDRDYLPQLVCGYREADSWGLRVLYTDGAEKQNVHSELGSVELREHTCIGGSGGEHYLLLNGTIRVQPERLARLNSGQLAIRAGAWADEDEQFDLSELGSAQISQYTQKYLQAGCAHTLSGTPIDAERHRMDCAKCGYFFQEEHSAAAGSCTGCGYRSLVTGTVRYRLNGRTEQSEYCEMPLAWVRAEQFKGYRTLPDWQVPAEGGLVELTAEPIRYTLTDGAQTYELQYDNSLFIPKQEQKGYEQIWYEVVAVRGGAD